MPCTTKIFGGCGAALVLVAFITLIMGIVIMTNSMPTTKCGGPNNDRYETSSSDSDSVDSAMMMITWPLMLGGILGSVGGALAAAGGFKPNKCMITGAAVTSAIGGSFLVVGSLATGFFAAIFGTLCDDYKCDIAAGSGPCGSDSDTECREANVCCDTTSDFGCIGRQCKEVNDWACDLGGQKAVAMAFGYIASILAWVTCGCTCGAACCCPNSFTEMPDVLGTGGSAGGQPAVVGQPVG